MAQYYDNFEGYDAGDITSDADWEGEAYNVVHGQDTSYLERTDQGQIAWTVESANEVETVIKARFTGSDCAAGPATRAEYGTDENPYFEHAYIGFFSNSGFAAGNYLNRVGGGSGTTLSNDTDTGVVDETSWFWMRIVASSDSLEYYVWQEGESEPSTPQLTATDGTYGSGYGGINRENTGGGSIQVDSIGIGTEGDSAPTEPVSADPPAAPTNLQLSEQ